MKGVVTEAGTYTEKTAEHNPIVSGVALVSWTGLDSSHLGGSTMHSLHINAIHRRASQISNIFEAKLKNIMFI